MESLFFIPFLHLIPHSLSRGGICDRNKDIYLPQSLYFKILMHFSHMYKAKFRIIVPNLKVPTQKVPNQKIP
jgi:hypothetical protein